MRRLVVATVLTLMVTLLVTVPAGAHPASATAPAHASIASSHIKRSTKNGAVKVGSKWTIYYKSWSGTKNFCEVIPFGANHVFTGDASDHGTWSGNLKMTFADPTISNAFFASGERYTAKFEHSGQFNGAFLGTVSVNGYSYGPFELVSGPDSTC